MFGKIEKGKGKQHHQSDPEQSVYITEKITIVTHHKRQAFSLRPQLTSVTGCHTHTHTHMHEHEHANARVIVYILLIFSIQNSTSFELVRFCAANFARRFRLRCVGARAIRIRREFPLHEQTPLEMPMDFHSERVNMLIGWGAHTRSPSKWRENEFNITAMKKANQNDTKSAMQRCYLSVALAVRCFPNFGANWFHPWKMRRLCVRLCVRPLTMRPQSMVYAYFIECKAVHKNKQSIERMSMYLHLTISTTSNFNVNTKFRMQRKWE